MEEITKAISDRFSMSSLAYWWKLRYDRCSCGRRYIYAACFRPAIRGKPLVNSNAIGIITQVSQESTRHWSEQIRHNKESDRIFEIKTEMDIAGNIADRFLSWLAVLNLDLFSDHFKFLKVRVTQQENYLRFWLSFRLLGPIVFLVY